MSILILAIAIGILVVVVGAAWLYMNRRRSEQLQHQFGHEYERAVSAHGDRGEAEAELESRRKRVAALQIKRLTPQDARRFGSRWDQVQAHFVDEPSEAIDEADTLVAEVMQARGYPVSDFEARTADISVDHPEVVSDYRSAHAVYVANERDSADTEQLRTAMIHYRSLFRELLETTSSTGRRKEVA